MNKTSLITSAAGIALLLASAAPALADDNVSADASVSNDGEQVQQGGGFHIDLPKFHLFGSTTIQEREQEREDQQASTSQEREQEREHRQASSTEMRIQKEQEHGDNAIDERIQSLQDLIARLDTIKLLPADTLATVKAALQAEIDKLTALKGQIGSDTATSTLKVDVESITKGNRVFLLVEPKARITSAASRIDAVVSQLTALGTKLQARITAAQAAGTDVSEAVTAMTDFNAKIADAKVQADAAVALVANLQVDNGDKTILATNQAALKDARTKLDAAEKDLATARHDAATIYGIVKGKGGVEGQGDVHATTSAEAH